MQAYYDISLLRERRIDAIRECVEEHASQYIARTDVPISKGNVLRSLRLNTFPCQMNPSLAQ